MGPLGDNYIDSEVSMAEATTFEGPDASKLPTEVDSE
jgi:hypothetical protein